MARHKERNAPLAQDLQPVRPGMSGGQYKPLSDADVAKIEQTVYQLLEEIGLSQAPDTGIEYMTSVGAVHGEDGALRFPRRG